MYTIAISFGYREHIIVIQCELLTQFLTHNAVNCIMYYYTVVTRHAKRAIKSKFLKLILIVDVIVVSFLFR